MAKDLRLDVVTSSDGKGLVEAATETEHLAKKVDDLGDKMRGTAVNADLAAGRVDDLGDKMRQTARDGGLLAIELEAVKVKQKELAAEFDYTGDRAILKQISATRRYSGQLKQLQKDLEDTGDDLGNSVESGISSKLGDLPTSIPVLIGALTSPGTYGLLAQAGTLMGGAVLTGIGLAGVGTGIALSINSSQVQGAVTRLKQNVGFGLSDAASSFEGPLTSAIGRIESELESLTPGIKADFAEIAPEVDKLGAGAAGFLDAVVPAFGRAVVAAKPLVDLLAEDLPGLGQTLGGLFDTISANSGVAQQGLQEIVTGLEEIINFGAGVVVVLSDLTRASNDFYYTTSNATESFVGAMAYVANAIHLPGNGLDRLHDKLGGVTQALAENKQEADGVTLTAYRVADAFDKTAIRVDELTTEVSNFNLQLDVMDGRLNRTEALNNLTIGIADFAKQLHDTKDAFDSNTAAGAINQNTYIGLIKKAEEYRDSLIKTGVSQAAADLAFQDMVKQIDAVAVKAGLSATQINDLNKQLGITEAMKPITVSVNVKTAYTYTGKRPNLGTDIPFLASGGHFDPGPIVVGEHGPELLVPDSAGTIIPNLGSGGGGGYAPAPAMSGPTVVQLQAVGDVAEVLLSLLRPVIRGPYGGDVNAALAGNR